MTKKPPAMPLKKTVTHIAAHTAAALVVAVLVGGWDVTAAAVAVVVSWLPDLDHDLSLPHRGITHSLYAVVAVAVLGYAAAAPPAIIAAAVAGVASHLLVDMLHGNGVQLLYPSRQRYSVGNVEPRTIATAAAVALVVMSPAPALVVARLSPTPAPAARPAQPAGPRMVTPAPTPTAPMLQVAQQQHKQPPTPTATPTPTPTQKRAGITRPPVINLPATATPPAPPLIQQ